MSMITVIVAVDVVVGVAANSTMQGRHFCLILFFIENGDRQTRRSIDGLKLDASCRQMFVSVRRVQLRGRQTKKCIDHFC